MTVDGSGDGDDLRRRLREVFVRTLELDSATDVDRLRFRDDVAWDSVGHMALVAAIEDEFDVELNAEELIEMDSFEVALRLVARASRVSAS